MMPNVTKICICKHLVARVVAPTPPAEQSPCEAGMGDPSACSMTKRWES
ncbi:hypothetical protein FM112_13515 [Gulosibacter sp. 10]|nr:hypothetical protein FM112_13515 [Gulosibacter sp. 10]